MLTTLKFVLDTLQINKIHKHFNANKETYYYCARWLGNSQFPLDSNCIYVGYASMLPAQITESDIGLILFNDINRDFSDVTCDLVELDNGDNLAELCILIKENVFRTREISSISQQIIERLIQNSTLKEIVDLTATLLENPVFINFHFSGRRFYHSAGMQNENEADILKEIKRNGPSPETLELVNNIWNSPYASISNDGHLFHGKRRMQIAISKGVKGGPKIGILTVFELNRKFTDLDLSFMNFVAYLFSIRAVDPNFDKQLFGFQYEQKLQDLLSGSSAPKDMDWCTALFGTYYSNFSLAITDIRKLTPTQTENLKYYLLQSSHYSTTLTRGSYLILITNRKDNEIEKYHSTLEKSAKQYHLHFGVSDDFTDIRKLKKYYTQAKRVRELNLAAATEGIFYFAQQRFQLMLYDLSSAETPDLFSNDSLEYLQSYDTEKNTEYCKTLSTYVRCGMNKEMTRKELNIHRNTLTYRLDKIEEILKHPLDDGPFLISLYFSGLIQQSAKK